MMGILIMVSCITSIVLAIAFVGADMELGESTCPGLRNVALGKYTEQSGTHNFNDASKALDLCRAGPDQSSQNCAQIDSTSDGLFPGRDTEDSRQFHGVAVKVGDHVCDYFDGPAIPGQEVNYTCNTSGRYVSVSRHEGRDVSSLTLCEVEVWGHPYGYTEYDSGITCKYRCGNCGDGEFLCYHVEHTKDMQFTKSVILGIALALVSALFAVYAIGKKFCRCKNSDKYEGKAVVTDRQEARNPLMSTFTADSITEVKNSSNFSNDVAIQANCDLDFFSYKDYGNSLLMCEETEENQIPLLSDFPSVGTLLASPEDVTHEVPIPTCVNSFSSENYSGFSGHVGLPRKDQTFHTNEESTTQYNCDLTDAGGTEKLHSISSPSPYHSTALVADPWGRSYCDHGFDSEVMANYCETVSDSNSGV